MKGIYYHIPMETQKPQKPLTKKETRVLFLKCIGLVIIGFFILLFPVAVITLNN